MEDEGGKATVNHLAAREGPAPLFLCPALPLQQKAAYCTLTKTAYMYKVFLTAIFVFIAPGLFAQTNLPTDYLTPGFHKGRHEAARTLMPDSSVMVVVPFPKRNYSNDVD